MHAVETSASTASRIAWITGRTSGAEQPRHIVPKNAPRLTKWTSVNRLRILPRPALCRVNTQRRTDRCPVIRLRSEARNMTALYVNDCPVRTPLSSILLRRATWVTPLRSANKERPNLTFCNAVDLLRRSKGLSQKSYSLTLTAKDTTKARP